MILSLFPVELQKHILHEGLLVEIDQKIDIDKYEQNFLWWCFSTCEQSKWRWQAVRYPQNRLASKYQNEKDSQRWWYCQRRAVWKKSSKVQKYIYTRETEGVKEAENSEIHQNTHWVCFELIQSIFFFFNLFYSFGLKTITTDSFLLASMPLLASWKNNQRITAQHHLWLLKLLQTTALETLGCAQWKTGFYLKIYQRRAEEAVMREGCGSRVKLGLQIYSLMFLGPVSKKVSKLHKKCSQKQFIFRKGGGKYFHGTGKGWIECYYEQSASYKGWSGVKVSFTASS